MPTNAKLGHACLTAITLACAVLGECRAATLTTLHSFGTGPDGNGPVAALINVGGTLYGTTILGGSAERGTVFQIDPATGLESVVYSFSGQLDGDLPYAALTNVRRTLYGTTYDGGTANAGTVFKVDLAAGTEAVVYSFTGPFGAEPVAALIKAGRVLYGTAEMDSFHGKRFFGTVFTINLATGAQAIVHSFTGTPDGDDPTAALIAAGNMLYGTTNKGGTANLGTVFQIDPATGTETILHNFIGGADSAYPNASLIDVGGTLYGTSSAGGAGNAGTVFKIDVATAAETVTYSFTGGADGGDPVAALIDVGGALYGTTASGGLACQCGVVFKIDPASGAETVLHSFSGADGAYPEAALLDVGGMLYGTTYGGGARDSGTVFRLQR